MKVNLKITNGRVIDPALGIDSVLDVEIRDGVIADVSKKTKGGDSEIFDASGMWVVPGLVDLYAHLREPGEEYKEDIASGSLAAAKGGFTTVMCAPDTNPVIDNAAIVEEVIKKGEAVGLVEIIPQGAISQGLEGSHLSEIGDMARAGIRSVTNADSAISTMRFLRNCYEYVGTFGLIPSLVPLEASMWEGAVAGEGFIATKLGLKSVPAASEEAVIAREIALSELTGVPVHIMKVTTAGGVRLISDARARGVKVFASVTQHHLALDDSALLEYDVNCKVVPPLRGGEDRLALIRGLADGTIDFVVSDHSPQARENKELEIDFASYGMTALETAVPLMLDLVANGSLGAKRFVEAMATKPRDVFGIKGGRIKAGEKAALTVIDPSLERVISLENIVSKSKNSPFLGKRLKGFPVLTIFSGRITYQAERESKKSR